MSHAATLDDVALRMEDLCITQALPPPPSSSTLLSLRPPLSSLRTFLAPAVAATPRAHTPIAPFVIDPIMRYHPARQLVVSDVDTASGRVSLALRLPRHTTAFLRIAHAAALQDAALRAALPSGTHLPAHPPHAPFHHALVHLSTLPHQYPAP
ncbi:hypothetical protein OH76DRAFT_1488411 [Lentinus brumalis]|uniref:Uncharacterized protein n=1 Tax=Lentinus brumalis TaxID=2498619 RepID=A0A371CQY6_9APHY|nr:hypothetical protein OH76DRAFT_1488411 [Polyporus brumalis]